MDLPSDTMLYYTEHSFVYVMKELKTTYTIDIFKCEIKEVYIDCVDNNSMQREAMVHVICVSSTGIENQITIK